MDSQKNLLIYVKSVLLIFANSQLDYTDQK